METIYEKDLKYKELYIKIYSIPRSLFDSPKPPPELQSKVKTQAYITFYEIKIIKFI